MINKIKYIFFEGPDKVGKTTLRKLFAEKYTQHFATFDRSIVSNIVYDRLFERNSAIEYADLNYYKDKSIFVFLHNTDNNKLQSTMIKTQEHCVDYSIQIKFFNEIENKMKSENFNVIEIDTAKTEEECLKEFVNKVKTFIK